MPVSPGISKSEDYLPGNLQLLIPKEKALKLVSGYCYVSDMYDKSLKYVSQRHSNNDRPAFTDAEAMTVFRYAVSEEHLHKIRHIHGFTKIWLHSWFPKLPSYQELNARLNFLAPAWQALSGELLTSCIPEDCGFENSLVDSFPVITCKGRNRTGKAAREIAGKGFCSTVIRQREKTADDLFSCAVSTVRQPVESLFNRINVKTCLQQAAHVRSTAGLLVHVFANRDAAFICFIFLPLIRINH